MSVFAFRSRRATGEAFWALLGQFGAIAGRLVALKLLTTVLDRAVFGEVTLLLGGGALVAGVFFQPIGQAVLRLFPDAVRDGQLGALRKFAGGMMWRSGGVAAAFAAVAVGLWLGPWGGTSSWGTVGMLGALTAGDAWRTYEGNLMAAARDQRSYAVWSVVDAWTRAVAPLAAIRLAGPTAASVLAGQLVACLLVALAFRPRFVRPPVANGDPVAAATWIARHRPPFMSFIRPLIPFAMLGWIVAQADRYVLAEFSGIEAAGLYGAVYGLASQPFIALSSVGVLTFRPILFEAVSHGDVRKERRVILAWLGFAGAIAVTGFALVAALAPWIVRVATGPAFWSGATLMTWIAAAYGLQGLQFAFESILYARRRTPQLLLLQVIGAVGSMALYLGLVPRLGARGAAIGTLGSMLLTLGVSIALALRSQRAGTPTSAV
jgi:O-antigen/teichoic acid export membrane protein